jgi:hypothetical protein
MYSLPGGKQIAEVSIDDLDSGPNVAGSDPPTFFSQARPSNLFIEQDHDDAVWVLNMYMGRLVLVAR